MWVATADLPNPGDQTVAQPLGPFAVEDDEIVASPGHLDDADRASAHRKPRPASAAPPARCVP